MKLVPSLLMFALLVTPAAAQVKVDRVDGADCSGYKTYAWKKGTDAARPEVQQWIVAAVDRELKAKGLREVKDRRADVYVKTTAFAETTGHVRSNYVHLDVYDVGVLTSDLVASTKGVLLVDLIDGETDKPVWRGMATEVMQTPRLDKVRKKVDKVTRKMFKSFP